MRKLQENDQTNGQWQHWQEKWCEMKHDLQNSSLLVLAFDDANDFRPHRQIQRGQKPVGSCVLCIFRKQERGRERQTNRNERSLVVK